MNTNERRSARVTIVITILGSGLFLNWIIKYLKSVFSIYSKGSVSVICIQIMLLLLATCCLITIVTTIYYIGVDLLRYNVSRYGYTKYDKKSDIAFYRSIEFVKYSIFTMVIAYSIILGILIFTGEKFSDLQEVTSRFSYVAIIVVIMVLLFWNKKHKKFELNHRGHFPYIGEYIFWGAITFICVWLFIISRVNVVSGEIEIVYKREDRITVSDVSNTVPSMTIGIYEENSTKAKVNLIKEDYRSISGSEFETVDKVTYLYEDGKETGTYIDSMSSYSTLNIDLSEEKWLDNKLEDGEYILEICMINGNRKSVLNNKLYIRDGDWEFLRDRISTKF